MSRRALAPLLLLAACSRHEPPGSPTEPDAATAVPSATVGTAPAAVSAAAVPTASPTLTAFVPIRAKLVGHTSLVLKLEDQSRHKVVFRAAFREGGTRYRGEIAAYRLGLELGLGARFAEAVPHAFPKDTLRGLLSEADRAKLESDALIDEQGAIHGALVRWIDGLETPAFERDPWVSRWKGWIQGDASIEPENRTLAGEISTLVVFDYLTGNFDRWSGGNLGAVGPAEKMSLRYIDNDGAFLDPMPKGPLAASKQRLLASTRFSRSFVDALRTLAARPDWTSIFGQGEANRPLLPPAVVDGVRARALEALAHVDTLAKTDAARTYALP